jgi:hypothetical protein
MGGVVLQNQTKQSEGALQRNKVIILCVDLGQKLGYRALQTLIDNCIRGKALYSAWFYSLCAHVIAAGCHFTRSLCPLRSNSRSRCQHKRGKQLIKPLLVKN